MSNHVIIGRQSSHYTRVVRMLAIELDVAVELEPVHDLLSNDPDVFAGNPALKLPALRLDGDVVWGSANACRVLARRSAAGEDGVAWPEQARSLRLMNAHELVAHAMAAQVEVVFHEIVSRRAPDDASRKRRASLVNSLGWLDRELEAVRGELPQGRIALLELQLFCLLEHLPFRNPMDLSGWPALVAFADAWRQRPSARATPYRFDPPPA